MASIAVKDCEKELDRMERTIDERITSAITQVTEPEARELLARSFDFDDIRAAA